MKSILLTGSSGFVGKSLIKELKDSFHIVAPISAELDLKNARDVDLFFSKNKVDWIINCAVKGGRRTKQDSVEDFYNNIVCLDNLLSHVNHNCKLITFSSGAEIHKLNTFYGFSKKICTSMVKNKENIKNLRIYNVFGKLGMEDSFVYTVILKCLKNEKVTVWEDYEYDTYPICNVISLIKCLIEENNSAYEEIDCVYSQKYKLSEIAEIIKTLCCSKSEILIEKGHGKPYIGKAINFKKFSSKSIEEGFLDLILSIKNEILINKI